MIRQTVLAGIVVAAMGCGASSHYPVTAGMGTNPVLPDPKTSLIPMVNVVKASSWKDNATPKVEASDLGVRAFANGLDHPRWLYVLPNGDVLVAETNAPKRPEDGRGIKGFFFKFFQERAGGGVPSANRITLLRDTDGDGVADVRSVFLTGLNAPFGMALVGNDFYVANSDAVTRFSYSPGATAIAGAGTKLTDLPGGDLNHHWTKSLIASRDGAKLYAGIGSNSNVAENGLDKERDRAMIWEIDRATGAHRVFAAGLRNPVGMTWEPTTGALWVAVNERDELGSDLVPDYMTSVKDGGFYGWPFSYFGNHVDKRVKKQRPDLVARAIVPDYALGAHTASLGLVVARGNSLGFPEGMFIGQHGSWNRKPRSGSKVIFVPFSNGRPSGESVDVLSGFVDEKGNAMGRPVGVVIARDGSLLVADDVGNTIWRVSRNSQLPR